MFTVKIKKSFFKKGEEEFTLDADFSAGDGITVLSGASGAGKTTTLKIIAGILAPDKGTIKLDKEIFFDAEKKINLPIQKRRVGFVFQDYALFPHLSALDNVAYGVKTENKIEKSREILSLFHIEHLKNRIPSEMSGGEQQRTALARALASDPRIVLLDEPLSAVDVETRRKLLDEIEFAQTRAKIPFIYVTHNEAEAKRLGTRRVTIENGKTIAVENL